MTKISQRGLISHQPNQKADPEQIKEKIRKQRNPALPIEDQLIWLEELSQFDLGKLLLNHQGLNGA